MTILELREKRAKAWEAAKAFLDSHRKENGTLSAEDDAAYTRMEQEITDLGKEIARLERQEALDAELNRPVNKPLTGKPGGKADADGGEDKTGRASDDYRKNFWNAMRSKAPMRWPTSTNTGRRLTTAPSRSPCGHCSSGQGRRRSDGCGGDERADHVPEK